MLDLSTAMCPTAIGVAHEVPKNSPPQVYDQMQAAPMLSCLILPSVERDNLDAFYSNIDTDFPVVARGASRLATRTATGGLRAIG